jgi:hypothetical protein
MRNAQYGGENAHFSLEGGGSIFEGAGETMVVDQLLGGEGQEPPHRSAKEDRGGVRKLYNTLGVSFKRQVGISSMTTAGELHRNVS